MNNVVIQTSEQEGVGYILLDRPEAMNAIKKEVIGRDFAISDRRSNKT